MLWFFVFDYSFYKSNGIIQYNTILHLQPVSIKYPQLQKGRNLSLLLLYIILVSCSQGKVYYIDAVNGNDNNSGHFPGSAWISLAKVNQTVFQPGDKILFKAGDTWTGQLELKGSGTPRAPIQINRYGKGKNPAIHGKGGRRYTLLLKNIEYWEIRNLEITNTGKDTVPGRGGVMILAGNFGDCHHIVLDSLEIHHVNGSLIKKKGGGSAIYWRNYGDSVKTRFIDLQITNCHLHHCTRNGIVSGGYSNRSKWYPSLKVVIRNNLLEQIPGDGIVPIGTDGTLIEYNVMRDCPDVLPGSEAAAGIWPWSSDNTIIQFNEVSGHKAKWDGQGFDSDWNSQNTIIQYNYSHDNYGGFLLVCNNGNNIHTTRNIGTLNTIVRYNVSINDGIRPYETGRKDWFSPIMHITGPADNTRIYNNVFIISPKTSGQGDNRIVVMNNWGGPWPKNTFFANNIFYAKGTASFLFAGDSNTVFSNNCFFGNFEKLPNDKAAVFKDPGFKNVNARGEGFEVLKNFMLIKNSPCRGAGMKINADVPDLFGNRPGDHPDIGIDQSL